MQLLSGEAAARLRVNNVPSLGPEALLLDSLLQCEYNFSCCFQTNAHGVGDWGWGWDHAHLQDGEPLYTVSRWGKHFSIIWRGGKRKHNELPPSNTHTQRQRKPMKVTCSINSCRSQPALLIKTLSFWLLQWNATCLNQQASTQPTSSCLFPALLCAHLSKCCPSVLRKTSRPESWCVPGKELTDQLVQPHFFSIDKQQRPERERISSKVTQSLF